MVHHVIFIGEWPEETTAAKASVRARARACVSSGLVNKCRLFPIWGSSVVVVTYTSGGKAAVGGDSHVCACLFTHKHTQNV